MPTAKISRQDSLVDGQEPIDPSTNGDSNTKIQKSKDNSHSRSFGRGGTNTHDDGLEVEHAREDEQSALLGSTSNDKGTNYHKRKDNNLKVVEGKKYGATSPISDGGAAERSPSRHEVIKAINDQKRAEKRVLTSPGLLILFFILLFLTFLNLALMLILAVNAGYDLNDAFKWAPYRGSGLLEVWVAGIGSWAGVGALFFFSSPVYLLFLTNILSLFALFPLFLITFISPPLRRAHYPLMALPLALTAFTFLLAIGASYLVRRAHGNHTGKVMAMIAARQAEESRLHGHDHSHDTPRQREIEERRREEEMAKVMVGMEGGLFSWRRAWIWIKGALGFIGGLVGLTVITLLFANLCLTAFDNALPLPRAESKLVSVHPKGYPWSFKVHILCTDPPKHDNATTPTFMNFPPDHRTPRKNHTHYPTVLYEAPSGVPGSIAHLKPARLPSRNNPFPVPRPPNNGTIDESQTSPYPGSWIISLQEHRKVHRVCVWDRPGYGFSESGATELGQVADSLQQALEGAGETGPYILVGDGYGGLITRVFASRHKKHVHSILHIDAQTAQTYFRFPPRYNLLTLKLDRLFNHLIPTLLSPLGIHRFYSLFAYYDSATARVLASKRPHPASNQLSEKLQGTLLRELYLSHTHDSASYKTLLTAQPPKYSGDIPAIILSSDEMMKQNKAWAEGQRSLAEEITSEDHRVSWEIVKGKTGHDICSPLGGKDGRGRRYCTRALKTLFALD